MLRPQVSPVVSVNLDPASNPAADRTDATSARFTSPGMPRRARPSLSSIRHGGATHHDDGRFQTGAYSIIGSARDRVEYVHGDDPGCVRPVDHRRDHAGGLFAVGLDQGPTAADVPRLTVAERSIADSQYQTHARRAGGRDRPPGLRSFA